eukprot:6062306-Pyramimonas_sp.AAC.1
MLEFLENPTALTKRPRREPPAPAAAAASEGHHVPGAGAGHVPDADAPAAAGDGLQGGGNMLGNVSEVALSSLSSSPSPSGPSLCAPEVSAGARG